MTARGGDQEQAAGSLHPPEDEGRQEDTEGQGYQARGIDLVFRNRFRIQGSSGSGFGSRGLKKDFKC